jgi:tetratricopeptide (TPR) repeat protein
MIAIVTTIIIIIGLYIAFLISSPIITIFHELGHAFAYLILTRPNKIDIYIGYYGDNEDENKKAINFKSGKLNFYIKRSFPFVKGGGLCKSDKAETNYLKEIIILLAGSGFAVLASLFIGLIIFNVNVHGSIKLFCALLILFSINSLYISLYPKTLREAYFGSDLDNDGKQFIFVKRLKKLYAEYVAAIEIAATGDYKHAIEKLAYILEKCPDEEKVLRKLALYSTYAKHYSEAETYLLEIKQKFEFSTTDILNLGCMQSFINKNEESILNYRIVLKNDADNITALNNLGYVLSEKGEYNEAQQLLEKAMQLFPETGYIYNTIGYLKVLKGDLEEGKDFIDKSIRLDAENAYAYKALGVYHLKVKDIIMAKDYFKKAKELDSQIDLNMYANQLLETEQDSVSE